MKFLVTMPGAFCTNVVLMEYKWSFQSTWPQWLRQKGRDEIKIAGANEEFLGAVQEKGKSPPRVAALEEAGVKINPVDSSESEGEYIRVLGRRALMARSWTKRQEGVVPYYWACHDCIMYMCNKGPMSQLLF